ncbi:MAG: PAS domain-containing protein [Ruminococcus sp.]|nr:PAS domain-containing protein [Ruminococcus sp.]
MQLNQFFKSIIDTDRQAVVVCDTEHTIIYMNPSAEKRYEKRGGVMLIGQSILDCHSPKSRESILKIVEWFSKSKDNNIVHTFYNKNDNIDFYMIALRDEKGELIGYYEKHENRNVDDMKFYDYE